MDKELSPFPFLMGILLIFVVVCVIGSNPMRPDNKIWNLLIENADEFVYDKSLFKGSIVYMTLNDRDGKYICDVRMDMEDKTTSAYRYSSTFASSLNIKKSKKMFKCLLPNVPDDIKDKYISGEDAIKLMKELSKTKDKK